MTEFIVMSVGVNHLKECSAFIIDILDYLKIFCFVALPVCPLADRCSEQGNGDFTKITQMSAIFAEKFVYKQRKAVKIF